MRKVIVALFLLLFGLISMVMADKGHPEIKTARLIDLPTASSLGRGNAGFGGSLYANGGMLLDFRFGISNNFQFGVAFGGTSIIGREDIVWNGNPGIMAKYIFLDEDYYNPAMAFGFSSQGSGEWLDDRFQVKSKGFYLAMSKNFLVKDGDLGSFGIHGLINYCVTEREDLRDDNINFGIGFDKSLGDNLSLLAEYDFGINDNRTKKDDNGNDLAPTKGYGFLNVGLRWTLYQKLYLEVNVKDILKNSRYENGTGMSRSDNSSRELKLTYIDNFF